jgi:predicted Fe-Mo cluster-binding NifX family protein
MFVKVQPNRREGTMKIAIPMAGGQFSEHFGGAKEFLVFEADPHAESVGAGALIFAPEHKPGALPEWLAAQKVDAVIASAIGERALLMLAAAGIETYLSGGESAPSELAAACLLGKLPRANQENSRCKGPHHDHDGHGCGHH